MCEKISNPITMSSKETIEEKIYICIPMVNNLPEEASNIFYETWVELRNERNTHRCTEIIKKTITHVTYSMLGTVSSTFKKYSKCFLIYFHC